MYRKNNLFFALYNQHYVMTNIQILRANYINTMSKTSKCWCFPFRCMRLINLESVSRFILWVFFNIPYSSGFGRPPKLLCLSYILQCPIISWFYMKVLLFIAKRTCRESSLINEKFYYEGNFKKKLVALREYFQKWTLKQ